jgi:hypothetical protein
MFGMFKSDPAKKLKKKHAAKQEEAMQAQRAGDIQKFAALTEEAEKIQAEIEALNQS